LGLDEFEAAIWDATSRTPYCFFVGVAVFRLWRSGAITIKLPIWFIVALMLMVYILPPYPVLHAFEILVLLPVLVLLAANRDPPQRLVPTCVVLGNMSYAIYAIHYPIIAAFDFAMARLVWPAGLQHSLIAEQLPSLLPWIVMFTVVGIAFLLDRYFDTPLRRRLTRG